MQSVSQEDEFTEVNRKRKKRKATSSPTLPTLQKTGFSEQTAFSKQQDPAKHYFSL